MIIKTVNFSIADDFFKYKNLIIVPRKIVFFVLIQFLAVYWVLFFFNEISEQLSGNYKLIVL